MIMPIYALEHDDAALIRRLRRRDVDALNDLVIEHGPLMLAVARRFMRDENRAQEVVQDALITIWNKISSFQSRSKFSSWLYRITANAALMQLRRYKSANRFVTLDDLRPFGHTAQPAADNARPDVVTLHHELGDRLRRAIDELAEPYRTTVVFADVEGFSMAAIAQLTNSSKSAVKSRLHRGRLTLKKKLLPYLGERS